MVLKIVCDKYAQVEAFKTGSKLWDNEIQRVNDWESSYQFDRWCKDLFYSLLQTGIAYTVSSKRGNVVETVLKDNGYEVNWLIV